MSARRESPPRRVIKLGGSLLSWQDWPDTFRHWHSATIDANDVLVVGGGPPVERLRRLDSTLDLGDLACHEIAIELMSVNAHQVAHALDVPLLAIPTFKSRLTVIDITRWCAQNSLLDRDNRPLPTSWRVTSDSIAAAVARHVQATEIVLLKSADPPEDMATWTENGFTDPMFSKAIQPHTRVSAINLRR